VIQFDSPQKKLISYIFAKNADTGEDLSKERVVLDRVVSHAFKLFDLNSYFFKNHWRK
jgi:hypothetical protein